MTKKELIDAVSAETLISKSDTGMMLEAITKVITDELVSGGSIRIPGLGSFSVGVFSGHKRRLPQGDTLEVPDQRRVHFKSAKGLRERMNPV